jgi:two-component system, OmpR family, response regulator QseB
MKLLLVEDDLLLGDGIRSALMQQGFAVDWETREDNARAVLQSDVYSLVILDLALPQLSGIKLLHWLRERKDPAPVLMLTALDESGEKVAGLGLGADDYLIKPFDFKEVCARTRGLLRRAASPPGSQIAVGSLMLDLDSRHAFRHNTEFALSGSEFTILRELMLNVGQILSREYMERCLRGRASQIVSNTVEVHVHNIRRKLGRDVVRTVRKAGYMVEKHRPDNSRKEKDSGQLTTSP